MKRKETIVRWLLFIVGLLILSLGTSVTTRAGLGTSPISAVPYVLSLATPYTFGELTFVYNLLLIATQKVLLGKLFKLSSLWQIPLVFVFGAAIDVTMALAAPLVSDVYWQQCLTLLAGLLISALGITLEVVAATMVLPGEGVVVAMAMRFEKPFPRMKLINDAVCVLLAAAISLIALGALDGVREGTLVLAALTGVFIKLYLKPVRLLADKLLGIRKAPKAG